MSHSVRRTGKTAEISSRPCPIRCSFSEAVRCAPSRPVLCREGDEIARRHDIHSGFSDQLDRARVHASHVRNRAVGRVFHRDPLLPRQQTAEAGFERLASRIVLGGAGKMRERAPLDGVHELARLAAGGNQIEPAPCRQVPGLPGDRRDVGRDRVQPPEVVEQPGVESVGGERGLDGRDVHGRRCPDIRKHL